MFGFQEALSHLVSTLNFDHPSDLEHRIDSLGYTLKFAEAMELVDKLVQVAKHSEAYV